MEVLHSLYSMYGRPGIILSSVPGITVCNQLLPVLDDAEGDSRAHRLLRSRNKIQRKYLDVLRKMPQIRKVIPIELQDREITGLAGLGKRLLGLEAEFLSAA